MKWTKFATLWAACVALLAFFQGCSTGPDDAGSAKVSTERSALGVMCTLVPGEFVGANDGCDCPSDGDTSCDADCAAGNPGGGYCGCEYCYPEQPPPPGPQCGLVPAEYLDAGDGCDCPANGNQGCDPDCADANPGGAYCGCEYCHPEDPPPASGPTYTPPAEGAAFGIPGTPPSVAVNSRVSAQTAGRLPGSGSVSVDGAYSYTLPVGVPKGRAGMEPTISVDYHSRRGDGLLGVGWSLSAGQSTITRCGKHYASGHRFASPQAAVRQTDGVKFLAGDQLCLDGQKLELVLGGNALSGSEYRTEVDTFAKIVAFGPCTTCEPTEFKIWHKNGEISTYTKHGGTSSTGTQLTGYYVEGTGQIATLVWARTKLEDRSGNAIEYKWTKENATASGQEQSLPRLTHIYYTSCSTTGGNTCPYGTDYLRKVKFNYAVRSDARVAYSSGVRLDSKHRLASIEVYGHSTASNSLVWTYSFNYRQSAFTSRSLLESVGQCAGSQCLPPTTFSWQDSGKSAWQVQGLSAASWNLVEPGQSGANGTEANASEVGLVVFDADGDGHQEVVMKEWPSTAIDQTTGRLKRTSDTMGVGPVDYLLKSDRSGYFLPQPIDLENDGHPAASARCGAGGALQGEIADLTATTVIDLDRDGREELVVPLNRGCPFQWVSSSGGVSTGVRLTPGVRLATPDPGTALQRSFGILSYDRTSNRMERRTAPIPFASTHSWDSWRYSFADLTGDGLPEALFGANTSNTDPVMISRAVATGSGGTEAPNPELGYAGFVGSANYDTGLRYSWQPQPSSVRTSNLIRSLDTNGDGRAEIVQISYDGSERTFSLNALLTAAVRGYKQGSVQWTASQNLDGSGTPPAQQWPAYPGPSGFLSDTMAWRYLDINGDGLKDGFYARHVSGNVYVFYYRLNAGNGHFLPEQEVTVPGPVPGYLWLYGAYSTVTIVDGVVRFPLDSGMRFADMNGDGRDDLVLLGSLRGAIMYSNGAGFDAPVDFRPDTADGYGRVFFENNMVRFPASQLADLDGDGQVDLVEFVRDPSDARKRKLITVRRVLPAGVDVMTEVKDGLGTSAAESVTYGQLSDQILHATDAIPRSENGTRVTPVCRYPAACVSKGLVVKHYSDFRSSRLVNVSYGYAGARIDVTGRGWLGFRETKTFDNDTGTEVVATFDQSLSGALSSTFHLYPGVGTPKTRVEIKASSTHHASLSAPDGKRVRISSVWTPTFNAALPFRTLRSVTTTTITDVNPLSQSTPSAEDRSRYVRDIQYSNDGYGRLTTSTESAADIGFLDGATLDLVTTTHTTTNTYLSADTANWLVDLVDSSTETTTRSNDPSCQSIPGCASVSVQTQYEYEANARRLLRKRIHQPGGGSSQKITEVLESDDAGLLRRTRRRDSAGNERVSETDYEVNGIFPVKQRNPVGHVSHAQYSMLLGVLDRTTDPNGVSVNYVYDTLGRLRRTNYSNGHFVAQSFGRVIEGSEVVSSTTISTASGADTKTFYDARGRATLTLTPGYAAAAGVAPDSTTSVSLQYDALGNVSRRSFARLAQSYGSALGATLSSLAAAHSAGAEVLSAAQYDTLGRPARLDNGDPGKTAPAEGAAERTTYLYPRLGDSVVIEPQSNGVRYQTRTIADARGEKRRVYHGNAENAGAQVPITYTYTALGDLASIRPQNSPSETFERDALGRITKWKMAGSPETRTWTYTAFDEVDVATEGREMSIKFAYDALGRVVSRTKDPNVPAATEQYAYEWDTSPKRDASCSPVAGFTLGALHRATGPGSLKETDYDSQGRPCRLRHTASGTEADIPIEFQLAFDSIGRLSSLKYPTAAWSAGTLTNGTQPFLNIGYRYATNGMLQKLVDATSTAYDLWTVTDRHPLGMLEQATNAAGYTTNRQYHANNLRPKRQDVVAPSSSTTSQVIAFHDNGMLKSRTFGTNQFKETYAYTAIGRRLSDYTRGAGSSNTPQVDVDYAYNTAGDITQVTTNVAVSSELGPVGTQGFGYGGGDPSVGTPLEYTDLLNIIDPSTVGAEGSITYVYDTAGRQRGRYVGGVKKRTVVDYNAFNLPERIDLQDGTTVLSTTRFQYDAEGQRTYKERTSAAGPDEFVVYSGKLFEAQRFLDASTTPATLTERVLARVYAEGLPLAEISSKPDGTRRTQFLYTDEQGSVNYRTEGAASVEASGSAFTSGGFRGFSPFGKRWAQPGNAAALFSSIGFTGHTHDDDLGLINMNGRIYDVEQQRFISRDPMFLPYALGGTNAYSYVLNNPTNLTDPTGFCPAGWEWSDVLGTCIEFESVEGNRVRSEPDDPCALSPDPQCCYNLCTEQDHCRSDPSARGCNGGPDDDLDGLRIIGREEYECMRRHHTTHCIYDSKRGWVVAPPSEPPPYFTACNGKPCPQTPPAQPAPKEPVVDAFPGMQDRPIVRGLTRAQYTDDSLLIVDRSLGTVDRGTSVPVSPPGIDVDQNIRDAETARWGDFDGGTSSLWFFNQVKSGGPQDYKVLNDAYEPFGNFNYGATGAAMGYSLTQLQHAAGWAQVAKDGHVKPGHGSPGFYFFGGTAPYGDFVSDQEWIARGYHYYHNHYRHSSQ